jgi:hypothetical protein
MTDQPDCWKANRLADHMLDQIALVFREVDARSDERKRAGGAKLRMQRRR